MTSASSMTFAAAAAAAAVEPKLQWCNPATLIVYIVIFNSLLSDSSWQSLPPLVPAGSSVVSTSCTGESFQLAAMTELIEPHKHELHPHFVKTADGFVLGVFRLRSRQPPVTNVQGNVAMLSNSTCLCTLAAQLPHAKASCGGADQHATSSSANSSTICRQSRGVVFLQHALMDSSAGWLLLGPERSLALQLADAGFDLWLGNSRGNRFSRNHTHLRPDQAAFWAWSWQHQASHDLPATIDYVLQVTQQQQLVFVGYSQGTMTALAALATQPRLATSISLAILLAPVAFTTGMSSPSFVLSSRLGLDSHGLSRGWTEWGSHQSYWETTCKYVPRLCLLFLTSVSGKNPKGNVDLRLVPTIFRHLPAGTSVQNMAHWAQSIRRRSMSHLYAYDFGAACSKKENATSSVNHDSINSSSSSYMQDSPVCNRMVYGQDNPPAYKLSAITTPIALFTGGQDPISTLPDVELLKQQLQPGALYMHQHFPEYGHLDFELGSDAPLLLYPMLRQLIQKFSKAA